MAGCRVVKGDARSLGLLVNKYGGGEDLTLHLFKNEVTPGKTSDLADFQEATFTGYSSITLTGSDWTITEGDGVIPSIAEHPERRFESTASQTIQLVYGYYLARDGASEVVWVERFDDGPYVFLRDGDYVDVEPWLAQP